MAASVPEQEMTMPLAYNIADGMPGETLGSPLVNDLTAVEVFSMIADATGGTFLFIPEVNYGGAIGEQFYESHIVNILNGMLTAGIVSVNPSSGPAGSTQSITITGSNTNFTDATALVFSGLDIPIIDKNVLSSTSIDATIQISNGATLGLRDLVAASPSETAVGVGVFRVNASTSNPTILSISPPSASQGTSLDVTIMGSNTNFTDVSSVFLGSGITITGVSAIDSERIVASIEIADDAVVGLSLLSVRFLLAHLLVIMVFKMAMRKVWIVVVTAPILAK